jgi:tetratricopeptide (TPR) repeat protein
VAAPVAVEEFELETDADPYNDLTDEELAELWPSDEEDDVAGDPADPIEAARLRRQRLLRRAMENLGGLPRSAPNAAPAAPAPQAPAPAAAPAPGGLPPEVAQLAAVIEVRHAELNPPKDHFTVLGVPRSADRAQVKNAFLSLAKTFHPDRLPPTLVHLAPKMSAVFESIREAYDVLLDDEKRKVYLASLERPQAPAQSPGSASGPVSSDQAAAFGPNELFKRGELLLKKRDFAGAEECYQKAHQMEPKAVYLAAQGWCIFMDPARKADAPRARSLMQEALKLDSRNDRALYQLGVMSRVEGDMPRAERYFREAISANPKHLEANQELRLIEMRKRNGPAPAPKKK